MDQPHDTYEDEDEYEYEYDDIETETFYVDLDLSSLNSAIKSNVPGAPKPVVPAKRPLGKSGPQPATPDEDAPTPNIPEPPEDEGPSSQVHQGAGSGDPGDNEGDDGISPFSTNVQILDISSTNPIISYLDQVYSCTWADMVGTNMFFTDPGLSNAAAPLHSTDDYDLIGMSRIKLVGDRTRMSRKAGSSPDGPQDDLQAEGQPPEREDDPKGRSLGSLIHTNPANNIHIKKQATFLDKLMDIKRQRGETDIVRTYVDETIASSTDKQSIPDVLLAEVEDLNRRILKGDAEALARLQEIYSRSATQDSEAGGIVPTSQEKDR